MDLEQMKTEAWCQTSLAPIELVRLVILSKMRYDWSEQCDKRWRYLLNVCNVQASEDVTLSTLSLEEAERLAAALEPGDLDCENRTDPVQITRITTEMRVAIALAKRIGPDARITPLHVFQYLHPLREQTCADDEAIRNVTEYVGLAVADTVMQRHGIPLDGADVPLEETAHRERLLELLMNHVADEILAGD
ncbi:MAG: hypothetical protein PHO92_00915 [Candidatus Peribacteraceae bacterium]|nr:hypothetical protein [Candidatus Peribacteraceae bacterium]